MLKLGICYEYGKGGLTKDKVKAVEWNKKQRRREMQQRCTTSVSAISTDKGG